jgi:hypothetical protein
VGYLVQDISTGVFFKKYAHSAWNSSAIHVIKLVKVQYVVSNLYHAIATAKVKRIITANHVQKVKTLDGKKQYKELVNVIINLE